LASKKIFNRTPKRTEYIVYRNRKGKIVKPRSGQYLIAEIRNRKTKKLTGYLNTQSKESKKPNPRRFTSIQRAILSTPKSFPILPKTPKKSDEWLIVSTRPVIEQIPKKIITRINSEVQMNGDVRVSIEIQGKLVKGLTDARYLDRKLTAKEASAMFGTDIFSILRDAGIRMSPKKRGDKEQNKRRHERKIKARVIFMGF